MPHFPVLAKLSQILERKVEKVREEERGQRQDLHVLATSYSGQLKAKTPNMIRESDFHHVGDKVIKKLSLYIYIYIYIYTYIHIYIYIYIYIYTVYIINNFSNWKYF